MAGQVPITLEEYYRPYDRWFAFIPTICRASTMRWRAAWRPASRSHTSSGSSGRTAASIKVIARGEFAFDGAGRPLRMHGVVVATTARRQAEQALRESDERLRLFTEHAPAALAMFDREMRYLAVSRRWLDDYGLDGQDVIGQSHYDVVSEIPARWRDVHRRGLAGEVVREDRDWFERADGSVGGIVIFTDVVVDASGTISFANPAVERMAGLPPGSLAGRCASAIAPALLNIDGQPLGEEDRPFQRVMRTGQPVHEVELAVTRPDGRRMPLSVNAAPLRDADGSELRPGILDDLGIVAAIEWQAQEFQARTGIRCVASLPPGATRVDAALALTSGAAALDIRDNGRGITAEAASSARSIGLLGMRERARIFGGEVTVAAAAPRGTRVHAEIPLGTQGGFRRTEQRARSGPAGVARAANSYDTRPPFAACPGSSSVLIRSPLPQTVIRGNHLCHWPSGTSGSVSNHFASNSSCVAGIFRL